jgi:hypothetical protein
MLHSNDDARPTKPKVALVAIVGRIGASVMAGSGGPDAFPNAPRPCAAATNAVPRQAATTTSWRV